MRHSWDVLSSANVSKPFPLHANTPGAAKVELRYVYPNEKVWRVKKKDHVHVYGHLF